MKPQLSLLLLLLVTHLRPVQDATQFISADMANGGDTILLQGGAAWHGVGHNAVYKFDDDPHYYMIFHGYDAADNGRSKLRIVQLPWDNAGWPAVIL